MKMFNQIIALSALSFFVLSGYAFAQGQLAQEGQPVEKQELNPRDIPSLMFTFWEHTAIIDAKRDAERQAGTRRAVTEDELARELRKSTAPAEPKPKPPPEMRELRLGGILYTNKEDWTIWLNEQRVTPTALPSEIIDLRVSRHYIEVKWYDDYTAQIFPIKLRPHQRFNLDSRIFLPG